MRLISRRVVLAAFTGITGTIPGCSRIGWGKTELYTLGLYNVTQEEQTFNIVVQSPEGNTFEETVTLESISDSDKTPFQIPDMDIPTESGTYTIQIQINGVEATDEVHHRETVTLENGSYEWVQSIDEPDDVDLYIEVFAEPGTMYDTVLEVRTIRMSQ